MIARLKGTLVERGATSVVVDCAGVGYDVTVSMVTLTALPEPGSDITLRVYTQVQENKIALYGFATAEERDLFDRLITVKNVGPATAIEVLSGAPSVTELAQAIARGDVAALTHIRGVGRKRADLLVVELREKCELLLATWGASGMATAVTPQPARKALRAPLLEDVLSALVNMGWRAAEADKVVGRLEVPPGATLEHLIVEALRAMPRA